MNYQVINCVIEICGFILMALVQSVFINGIKESMKENNILHFYDKWIRTLPSELGKPMGVCIKCASSFWGGVTYWPFVLIVFGFHWQEILVFVMDVGVLVYLNLFFYKKI